MRFSLRRRRRRRQRKGRQRKDEALEVMKAALLQNSEAIKVVLQKLASKRGPEAEERYPRAKKFGDPAKLVEKKGLMKVLKWHDQVEAFANWRSRMSNFLS